MDVFVIWWQWLDGSGAGIARVHSDRQRAEEERDLLSAMDASREYKIDEQPLYGALANAA
jgi:hypothetical protein